VKDLGRHTSLNAAKGDVGDSVDNTYHHVVSIKVNADVEEGSSAGENLETIGATQEADIVLVET